jgi:hypothetical protein
VLYDYLRDQKQKATMFYIGSNVMDWPLQAQRGLVDGHDICASRASSAVPLRGHADPGVQACTRGATAT